ncbi:MAG: hypothetical protein JWN14_35 [Chthonomonadales bacterium]|nr:hypothetical protein [Chthonomonadales bacterium]
MPYIHSAEQVRRLLPFPDKFGTPVQHRICRACNGTRRVLVNRTGIAGDFEAQRCWECKGTGVRR